MGLLLASAKITELRAPSCSMSHAMNKLLRYLLVRVNFKNPWAPPPHLWFEPRICSTAGQDSTARPLTCLYSLLWSMTTDTSSTIEFSGITTTSTMSTIEVCDIVLNMVFLEPIKHQNLTRLRCRIPLWFQNAIVAN